MSKSIQEITKIMSKTTPNGEVNFEPMDSDVADRLNGTEITDSDGDRVKIKDTGKTITEDDTSALPKQKLETQDIMNIVKDLNTVVKDTLREHGDTVAYTKPKINTAKTRAIIYVTYEQDPDNPGKPSEDRFDFLFSGDKVYLEGQEICPLIKRSGTLTINKDIAKNGLMNFLDKSEDNMGEGEATEDDVPNGQGFENPDMEAQDSYKTDNETLGEGTDGIVKVQDTIQKAKATPQNMFSVIYNGFKFNITYLAKDSQFEAIQFFEPGWGHSHSFYSKDEADLLNQIKDAAENDKIYTRGGKYGNINEELLLGFRKAADAYKANPKDKETIKELFRQARNFEGNSIQAKLRNAIKMYKEAEPIADDQPCVSCQDDRSCPCDLSLDMSLFIRLLEFTREEMADEDVPIHLVAENLAKVCKAKGCACMDDYEDIIAGVPTAEEQDKADLDESEGVPVDEKAMKEQFNQYVAFLRYCNEHNLKPNFGTWMNFMDQVNVNECNDSIDLNEVEDDDRFNDVLHRANNLDQVGGQDLRDAVMDAMAELYDLPESLDNTVVDYIKHSMPGMTVEQFKQAVDYVLENIDKYIK